MYKFLLSFLFFFSFTFAQNLELDKNIEIYITKKLSLEEIKKLNFNPFLKNHINLGFTKEVSIWLKIKIENLNSHKKQFFLEFNNPLLEDIFLYSKNKKLESGMLHIDKRYKSINPSFLLDLEKNEKQIYYINIKNTTTALQFSVLLKDIKTFKKNDLLKQFFVVFFIGVILAFIIYSFSLFIYTKEKSYFFYCIYILTLLFQQLTYIGFLPLYAPKWFTYYDNLLVVPKVALMIITATIFARSFLKTQFFPKIDKVYKTIIYLLLLQVIFLSSPSFYYPEITVFTGLFFIFFNLFTSIFVYKNGNKQARFFIIGWFFLSIGYFLIIIDALGLVSIMYFLPPLILILTLIEALFLLLAFIDRLSILQKQKQNLDKKLYDELEKRNILVEEEVKKQTNSLKNLYRELHHRVKNNLQIILSLINLQSGKIENKHSSDEFLKLENRIKAIAKTHEILYQNEDIETIDMEDYIERLCSDLNISYCIKNIEFEIKVNAIMPLKEAVYVGIIINELLSNSIKHAKKLTKCTISIVEIFNEFYLEISDNGLGYDEKNISYNSLGLNLVNSLVKEQLNGEIEVETNNYTKYDIRFKI